MAQNELKGQDIRNKKEVSFHGVSQKVKNDLMLLKPIRLKVKTALWNRPHVINAYNIKG